MKLLIILCTEELRGDIRELLERHGAPHYSEVDDVSGVGRTGRHFGTKTWPGRSALFFSVVDAAAREGINTALAERAARLLPGEGLRAFATPAEVLL